jgi:hypothetical protein
VGVEVDKVLLTEVIQQDQAMAFKVMAVGLEVNFVVVVVEVEQRVVELQVVQ